MNKTLWIDVTMLINWSGKMTGIQRVEYNLASRFSTMSNVKFFVFDKASNRLLDFDFKHIEFKINSQQNDSAPVVGKAEETQVGISIKSTVPNGIKRLLKPLYHHARHRVGVIKNSLRSDGIKTIQFKDGDSVLILSGDWSDGAFLGLMEKHKKINNLKIIQIVYDMLPSVYPSYFIEGMPEQFTGYMKKALPLSDHVLAISESTKKDIESFIAEHELRQTTVDVFRLGDDFVLSKPERPEALSHIPQSQFILTVGTVEARKNHQLILDAYILAAENAINLPTIVVAGKKGWLVESFLANLEKNPLVKNKFVFLQPTDKELAWLYKNCTFTVFPSVYEGWGLPVAESLFNGKLCISSNSSSMPEIAGDMIDYFSPTNPAELLRKMDYYLSNKNQLSKKEKLIAGYKPTSWDDSFAQVRDLIG